MQSWAPLIACAQELDAPLTLCLFVLVSCLFPCQSRRAELQRVLSRSSHELQRVVSQVRRLKQQLEREISRLFQDRPVHIVGEISNILAQKQ